MKVVLPSVAVVAVLFLGLGCKSTGSGSNSESELASADSGIQYLGSAYDASECAAMSQRAGFSLYDFQRSSVVTSTGGQGLGDCYGVRFNLGGGSGGGGGSRSGGQYLGAAYNASECARMAQRSGFGQYNFQPSSVVTSGGMQAAGDCYGVRSNSGGNGGGNSGGGTASRRYLGAAFSTAECMNMVRRAGFTHYDFRPSGVVTTTGGQGSGECYGVNAGR